MKKTLFSVLAATACLSFAACSNNTTDSKEIAQEQNEQKIDDSSLNTMNMPNSDNSVKDDADFVVKAADGGMAEVQMGELAQKNGLNAQVKAFGKMMAEDHAKADKELKALAAQKNISLPATISNDNQKMYNDMLTMKGSDFDKHYVEHMVSDHEKDVEMFRKTSMNAADPDIKAFAAKTLPTLERHLQRAREIQAMLK